MTAPRFDSREFRTALGSFATGVTIITTTAEKGEPVGLTANSFNSVSLDPPLILWSLAKSSAAVPIFSKAEHWNVHILTVDQEPLSNLFASKGADKFADLKLEKGISNAPLIPDCAARLQCRTAFQYDGGDHIIFIGEVLDFDKTDKAPLAFLGGQYAFTARKPYVGVNLSEAESASAHYNEDLLGYLVGRTHFQMLNKLKHESSGQPLSDLDFYILGVLCIQDNISLERLNQLLSHISEDLTEDDLEHLKSSQLIAISTKSKTVQLTHQGRQRIVEHIATAKGIEERIKSVLGEGEIRALKLLLKKVIQATDPGLPDLWEKQDKSAS